MRFGVDGLIKVVKSPLTGVVVGAAIAISLFVMSIKKVEPRYAVSKPELLAEVTDETPRLKLLWDNSEVANVYSIKILIWNDGRQFLDKSIISTTDPLRVIYPENIRILFHKFTQTSRTSLKLKSVDPSEKNQKSIIVTIVGDDALEAGDGGVLQILYSGPRTESFRVAGRIKGAKEGFQEVTWNSAVGRLQGFMSWFSIAATIYFLFGGISVLIIGLRLRSRSSVSSPLILMYVGTAIIGIGGSLYLAYRVFWPIVFGINWVS